MILLERFRWTVERPIIYASLYYESKREGNKMLYRFQCVIEPVNNGSYYGYNILMNIGLDGTTVLSGAVMKNANPSTWSNDIVYTTPWYTVENKTSGTTYTVIRIYSTQDSENKLKEYNVPIIAYVTSIGKIKVNGVFKNAKPYIKVNGAWRETKKSYVKANGVWKETK